MMTARLYVLVGDSVRMRDEAQASLLAGWTGPVKRVLEPDLNHILMDLDTPSFLDQPATWVVRLEDKMLTKHRTALVAACTQPAVAGHLLLMADDLDARDTLRKAATTAKVLIDAGSPDPKEIVPWLAGRITSMPDLCNEPGRVATTLVELVGTEPDALLSSLDTVLAWCGHEALTAAAVHTVVASTAEKPIWELTGAILDGQVNKALALLSGPAGDKPDQVLSALLAEIRKLMACCDTPDDAQAAAWAGAKGRPNLFHARKRARQLGKQILGRLLALGAHTQRQLRTSGVDSALAVELMVLHAQRLVASRS